jgi:hypothetical protein
MEEQMKKKYTMYRFPVDAYGGFNNKKNIFQSILKEEKINKKFTMADTLRFLGNKKVFVYNYELVNFVKNKKIRGGSAKLI